MSPSRVAVEACGCCGGLSLERRGFCPVCGSTDVRIGEVAGAATVWSLTQIHRPPSGADADAGPYTVALLALGAGPRLMARAPPGLAIGDAVAVSRPDIDAAETVVATLESS